MGGQQERSLNEGGSGDSLQPVHCFLPFLEQSIDDKYIAENIGQRSVENCKRNRQLRIFFSKKPKAQIEFVSDGNSVLRYLWNARLQQPGRIDRPRSKPPKFETATLIEAQSRKIVVRCHHPECGHALPTQPVGQSVYQSSSDTLTGLNGIQRHQLSLIALHPVGCQSLVGINNERWQIQQIENLVMSGDFRAAPSFCEELDDPILILWSGFARHHRPIYSIGSAAYGMERPAGAHGPRRAAKWLRATISYSRSPSVLAQSCIGIHFAVGARRIDHGKRKPDKSQPCRGYHPLGN
ncbi:hypothetical protein QDY28_09640 [Rhizobium sp. BR 362]